MWLADKSINRPVFATMLVLGLVILGLVSYPRVGVDLFPKIDFPMVNITTVLKGASPEVMDIDVTDVVEEAVNTINGVKTIASVSTEGVSRIIVEFVLEKDIDLALQDVREKVSTTRARLPRDVEEPVIEKVDPDATPVMWLALSGERPMRELSTYADEALKERLQRIEGVGAIRMGGLRKRQVNIGVDAERLIAHGITAGDLLRTLGRENVELPGGRLETGTKEYSIKIKGEVPRVEDFGGLIAAYKGGAPVRLRDLGSVQDGMEERRSIARFNGTTAVGLGVQKQSGTNTVEVIERVKRQLPEIRKTLPPGMTLDISFDQSDFIKRSINEVRNHLIYGGLFATLAVLIFLKSLRATLISALAIPTSIISTFAVMYAFGFTFNNMSMLALSLSIGILIDDAIIVIENIHRHMQAGMPRKEAASFAASEIGLAVMATTLAIVAIFLPVAFMKGIIGRFFFEFALTVVFSISVSLFVSFTLTPMLASRYLRTEEKPSRIKDAFDRGYWRVEKAYGALLGIALGHRAAVVALAALIFAGSLFITNFLGKEFVPEEDQGRFIVRLQSPVDYSVQEADGMFRKVEEGLRDMPEVRSVFYALGLGGESNKAIMFVALKPKAERKKSQQAVMADLRRHASVMPGLKATAEQVSMIGGGVRMVPIQFSIKGWDLPALQTYIRQISKEFAKLPGIVDVDTSLEAGRPEVRVYIDRDRAADLGVETADAAEAINFLIGGEVTATKFKDEQRGRRYDVKVRLNPEDRVSPEDIGRLHLRAKDGRLIELSSLVNFMEAGGPTTITRVDRQRAVTLFANLEGKPLGQAKAELDAISARALPPDYATAYKGMADIMGESFVYLVFALILGIVIAYMVLASQFESFVHPFTILLAMPFSLIGAFGALLLAGKTLNIFSFIGLILLMGLVKKNAILLVDYTNTLRKRGMSRREALLKAGPVRLRPILMTTVAMIFGMMPVAIGVGEGSETRSPMGIAVIGGLLTSLFLTLLVVPVAYDLMDDLVGRLRKKSR